VPNLNRFKGLALVVWIYYDYFLCPKFKAKISTIFPNVLIIFDFDLLKPRVEASKLARSTT